MSQSDFDLLCAPRTVEEWRIAAHRWFDRMWRFSPDPVAARTRAYASLAKHLNLTAEQAHISNFGIDECKEVIAFSKKKVRGGKKHGNSNRTAE